MRTQLVVLLIAGFFGACASGASPSASTSSRPGASGAPTSKDPASAVPVGTSRHFACSMAGGCGHAAFRPSAAAAGMLVRVEADNGYFGFMFGEWATGCPDPSIAFHALDGGPIGSEGPGPNGLYPGAQATLALTDASTAMFRVPQIPVGRYRPAFSCGSADEGFGQPEMPDLFTVVP
jgi:hypothetical protein